MKEILITSSVLIAVLAVLRLLLQSKISRRLQYGLWGLVALRLLIPVQFGHSDLSVTALTEDAKPIQQIQQDLQQPITGPSREEVYDQLLSDYLLQYKPLPDAEPITPEVEAQLQTQVDAQLQGPSLGDILTAVWLGGMGLMALWFLIANIAFMAKVKQDSAPWSGDSRVRISPNVPTPCLVGLFRPTVYLTPDSVRDEASARHVLTHELSHLAHWDHIWSLVRCVCLCVYWFDPLVWLAAILSKRDCELACDETALKRLGDQERIPYGKTLLATVSRSCSPAHILQTATAMSESKKQLKERMYFIVKKPKTLLTAAIAVILVAAIVTGCAFSGSQPDETQPTTEPTTQPTTTATEPSTDPTEPSTDPTEPSTEPSDPPTPPDDTIDPPSAETQEEALAIATYLIERYELYEMFQICCDFEYLNEDMSQYMTPEQLDLDGGHYTNSQYKLTCCHTPEEVRNHIRWLIDDALLTEGWPDDMLFTDGESLYLPILATGGYGYGNIQISYRSSDTIVAYADVVAEYDYDHSVAFHIQLSDGRWHITDTFVYATATDDPPYWISP